MYDHDDENIKCLFVWLTGLAVGSLVVFIVMPICPATTSSLPEDRTDRAEDACLSNGGIPLYDSSGKLEDCKKMQ